MKCAASSIRPMLACAMLTLFATLPARAALLNSVDISLIAPGGIVGDSTPINTMDSVPAVDGTLLAPGDGSNIGGWLLPSESIALGGEQFLLTIAQGAENGALEGITGYLGSGVDHALYQFSNLNLSGRSIVGLSLDANDFGSSFSGLASPVSLSDVVQLISPHSFIVNLDNLIFKDRGNGGSLNFVNLTVGFQTTPVPLPGSSMLLASGLLMLAFLYRRRYFVGGR